MCGRYTAIKYQRLADKYKPDRIDADLSRPRYNIAPTQTVPALLFRDGQKILADVRWGLVPAWAKDTAGAGRLINARMETVAEKPSFKHALARRRCLVLADGFYEWQQQPQGKQPLYIQVDGGEPFAFAGLYELWHPGSPDELTTCTIITAPANDFMRPIHERMPMILAEDNYDRWLDPGVTDPKAIMATLQPIDAGRMTARPVSSYVNTPKNDDERCIEPVLDPL